MQAGSLVLAGRGGEFTLVWDRDDRSRARPVPAGRYRLRTVRVERMKGKDHWFLSSAGPAGKPRAYAPGKTARIEVGQTVHFQPLLHTKGDRFQLGFSIRGADGRGLSIYRNDKRVPVTYRIRSARGKVLRQGRMNYG